VRPSGQFKDIEAALNQALAEGGGTIICPSPQAAKQWRMRAYRFRYAWRRYTTELYSNIPEREAEAGTSPWDHMVMEIDHNNIRLLVPEEVIFLSPDGTQRTLTEGPPEIERIDSGAYLFNPQPKLEDL
jgi:hypothetical protein